MPSIKLSHAAFFGGRVTFEALRLAIGLAAGGTLNRVTGALALPRSCPPALALFLLKSEYKGVVVEAEVAGELAKVLQGMLLKIPRSSTTKPGSNIYDRTLTLIEGCEQARTTGTPLEFK